MFCWKCGKEIPENVQCCPICGAQATEKKETLTTGNTPFERIHLNDISIDSVKRGMRILGHCKVYYFSAILGLILSLLFLSVEMIEVKVDLFYTHTEYFSMFEDKEFWRFVFALAYILAAIAMLLPLLTGKGWEAWRMYPAICVPVVTVVVLSFIMVSVLKQMGRSEIMDVVNAKASLTANGWIFVLVSILTVVITIKAAYAIAENQAIMLNEDIEVTTENKIPYWCFNCDMEGPFEGACPRCGSKSKKFIKQ